MIPEVHACSGYLVITAPTGVSRQRRSPAPRPGDAAEDHLDEDRVIAAQVPSWLDVEIGQRGE
jgi:hypothetical protein